MGTTEDGTMINRQAMAIFSTYTANKSAGEDDKDAIRGTAEAYGVSVKEAGDTVQRVRTYLESQPS